MNNRKYIILLNLLLISFSGIFIVSCNSMSDNGMIIITEVSGNLKDADYITGDSWRYMPKARIVEFDPANPEKTQVILTKNFYSAQSPEISFDGKFLLFTAQERESDPWQIWEIDLHNRKSRKVIPCSENCTDPAYLPGGRIIFSRQTVNDSLRAGHSIYACNLDGSGLSRITFNPHTYFASVILRDGRILTIDRQVYPDQGNQIFEVLRPDGTKGEMFYRGAEGNYLNSRGCETGAGKIYFIELNRNNSKKSDIVSIAYNRPLHSRVNITSDIQGDFLAVYPVQTGKLLVSYRKSETDRYALYELDPEKKLLGKAVFSDKDFDVLEVTVVGRHEKPKKLPSEVDLGVKTGLLLCQDISVFDLQWGADPSSRTKASHIEILGIDSTMGTVQVEEDGSFYLKVMADKAFRIQTLDNNGHVLNGPCAWIYLRPNERRGCVGCHEDSESVPDNKIPMSVKKSPVIVPVHIDKVVEKKISLE